MSLLLMSCGTVDTPAVSGSSKLATPCAPPQANTNPYKSYQPASASAIYSNYQAEASMGNPQALVSAQQSAYKILKGEIREWSDYVDIYVEGDVVVRITITYISPELLESVILNQALYNQFQQTGFSQALQNTLDEIGKRDEYLFLVTLTANKYEQMLMQLNPLSVDLPIVNMKLTDSENVAATPSHSDNLLSKTINLRSEPEHGYISFPIGVEKDQTCHWLLDPTWNTTISLSVPDLYVNGNDYGAQTWSMDYRTIIHGVDPNAVLPVASITTVELPVNFSPVMTPPPASNRTLNEDEWDVYWDGMSRFVWYHLTESIHH